MSLEHFFERSVLSGFFLSAALSGGMAAPAQAHTSAAPDAQVEASVLKALASAPELQTQNINSTTVFGVVTLSGVVRDETMRQRAEQLASKTPGVQKVVDELTLGNNEVEGGTPQVAQGQLQSDGTYSSPAADAGGEAAPGQQGGATSAGQLRQDGGLTASTGQEGQEVPPPNGPNTDAYGHPLTGQQGSAATGVQPGAADASQPYGNPGANQAPYGQPAYGGGPYGQTPMPPRRYGYPPQQGYSQPYGQGQTGGQTVTVPGGTLLQVRVNQHLSSKDIKVGTVFDAMVVNDIYAGGQVAIPRGAMVQGTVTDAESAGHLKGRGELGLRLTQVDLGGKSFPITTEVFNAHGGDKTIQTVNSAVGLGALGAIFGAVAGGGAGAAIGAGVGGAVGLGASAASGRGNVFIPSEAVLSFRTTEPASLITVSQAEMQRLGYGVPAGGPQMVRRYPGPYYGPGYYPRYYRPYGYYPY